MTADTTAAADGKSPEKQKERWPGTKFTALWVGFIAAVLVIACGLVLLWGIWDGNPVAAPFTRVGGETNVETAVDASQFWLTTPQVVVETPATASPSIMLGAAQCAMLHNAPLLFTTHNPKRQQLVNETMDGWNNPPPFNIQSPADVTSCRNTATAAGIADADRLSTLAGPYPFVQFPQVQPKIPTTQKLTPTVIFAAALQPGFLPDVAVGMALGAHMATANNLVSLVIVPRYLEADPTLVSQLERQHSLVKGGVVLGQAITVPDDTLALLRQLLTSRDRQGVLAQIQGNLGSVAPVVAALLALIGLAVADKVAPPLLVQVSTRLERRRKDRDSNNGTEEQPRDEKPPVIKILIGVWSNMANAIGNGRGKRDGQVAPTAGGNWRTALGDHKKVIVWLRSGTKVSGLVTEWHPSDEGRRKERTDAHANSILRLDDVTLTRKDGHSESAEFVLVSVEDIELIAKPSSDQAKRDASLTQ